MGEVFLIIFVSIALYFTCVFLVAWRIGRLDIVDVAWGGAFVVAALASLIMGKIGSLQLIVTGLVLVWALRLSGSILVRFIRSGSEDARYREIRQSWTGNVAVNAYSRIFLVQALLATIISLSIIFINVSSAHDLGMFAYIGIGFWLIGFLFESIGDFQLKRHLENPVNKGRIMTSGLWRYTRHPNYFGEATQWWAIFVIALSIPYGWITIVSPLTLTILLLFVTGVPLTERRFKGRPGWAEYKRRTSAFFPFIPRKD